MLELASELDPDLDPEPDLEDLVDAADALDLVDALEALELLSDPEFDAESETELDPDLDVVSSELLELDIIFILVLFENCGISHYSG